MIGSVSGPIFDTIFDTFFFAFWAPKWLRFRQKNGMRTAQGESFIELSSTMTNNGLCKRKHAVPHWNQGFPKSKSKGNYKVFLMNLNFQVFLFKGVFWFQKGRFGSPFGSL